MWPLELDSQLLVSCGQFEIFHQFEKKKKYLHIHAAIMANLLKINYENIYIFYSILTDFFEENFKINMHQSNADYILQEIDS